MIRYLLFIFVLLSADFILGQDVDRDLMKIKQRMDSIEEFRAKLVLDTSY